MELPCTRCRTAIPSIAKFCPVCGCPQQVAPPAPAPTPMIAPPSTAVAQASPAEQAPVPTGPQVCAGCGIQRASRRRGCDLCTLSYDQPGHPKPETGDLVWVGVRCHFECRACGHASPLNHLDVDGSVSCLRCGLDQVFDVNSWIEGLDHALSCGVHAGSRDKHQLGVTKTSLELIQSGMQLANGHMILRSLRVAAGPGHPPCARCHHPLAVELDGALAKTRCPQCHATQTCELPARAMRMCGAIRGVIAEELALDKREAKVDDGAMGASAIKCAHCAAPLRVTGASSIVTCEYCGASSRIPRRTMFALGHDHPVAQLWWLAFSRREAEALARPAPRRAEPRKPATAPTPPPAAPPPAKSDGAGVLIALGVVAAIGAIGYRDDVARWVTATRSALAARSTTPTTAGSAPRASPDPEARVAPFVDLAGCTCGPVQLRGQLAREGDRASIQLRAMRESRAPIELDRFELGDARALGLGCDRDRLVIAAGTRVAAWSLDRATKVWDHALPAALRGGSSTEPRCSHLKVARGRIAIPTGPRGTTVLKLIDGKR